MWPLAHQFSSCSHVGQQYTNSGPMLHNHASCLCIHFDWVTTKAQGNNKWLLRNHYRNSHQKGKDWLFTQKMWLWQMTRADPTWKMLLALPPPPPKKLHERRRRRRRGEDTTADSWGSVASGQGQTLRYFDYQMRPYRNLLRLWLKRGLLRDCTKYIAH